MQPRFSGWLDLGEVSFLPTDLERVIGPVTLADGADTLWIKITQMSGPSPWPWSYGVVSFKNTEGRPLGSVKAYSNPDGEVVRLGVGLPPVVRDGSLLFEPRSFNLAWIKKGNPWELKFEVQSGSTAPVGGGRTTVSFPVTDLVTDLGWTLALPNALARVDFR
jgi:hypothetical protein